MITQSEFDNICSSYGLESAIARNNEGTTKYYMINSCYTFIMSTTNSGSSILCEGTNPECLSYNRYGLYFTGNLQDRHFAIHSVKELKNNIEDCLHKYKELIKKQRIKNIVDI